MCHHYNTPSSIIKWKKCSINWHHGKTLRMSVGCQASGGKTGETENSVDWWVQRGRGKHKYYAGPSFMYIFLYQLHKYDYMACSWSCHFLCVCVCFLVRMNGFVHDRLGKCHSGWEYKLGPHIKSSVLLEQLYSRHYSLTVFPSISACLQWHMPNLPKSLQHVVNSLPKGNLYISPPGYTACQKYKRRKLPLCCCGRYCVWFWYSICCFLQKIDRLLVVFAYVCSSSSRCRVGKNKSWNSLSLKSDVESLSIRGSIHMAQITEKSESSKRNETERLERRKLQESS